MVDFSKLVSKKQAIDVGNPIKLFDSLDRQSSHITLRPLQLEVLDKVYNQRNERDLVLKMSTGSGKTAVALLYLKSYMAESGRPGVYLCPKVQLVNQVINEASKLGIKAVNYAAGEQHPGALGMSGQAIIVCTYQKLFNARTTFDRDDVLLRPIAIVVDDAHAGIEEIRDAYTLRLEKGEIHESILKALNTGCTNYIPSKWSSILNEDPDEFFEVPYWLWKPALDAVYETLSKYMDAAPFRFVWPHVQDKLRWCRCIVSGSGTEIVPEIIPIDTTRAFRAADHRIFMSGTLADDSLLVRELACEPDAARKPIISPHDSGIGERMILVPTLVNKELSRDWVMELCGKLAIRNANVVVLSSSEKLARDWVPYGATFTMGDDVDLCVNDLRTGSVRFAAFAQRYDGIDLPDNACRVLVIDGMPYGQGITDKYDSRKLGIPGGVRNRLIYRIEQGMGRAVRSHADYAVVILSGPELANFIANREVVEFMNPVTRAQIELAMELAALAADEVETTPSNALTGMLIKCLKRDEGWKQLYNDRIRSTVASSVLEVSEKYIGLATAERQAAQAAMAKNSAEASDIIERAIDALTVTDAEKGWLMQKSANYLYETNTGKALEKQRFAYAKNNSTFCPPEGIVLRPADKDKYKSSDLVLDWFKTFSNPNGAIAELQTLRTCLSYDSTPKSLEQAIMDLARPMGAIGSRPEDSIIGIGPDDLWLWPQVSLVIEVKNQRESNLLKKDSGQLHDSLKWFSDNYTTIIQLPTPVIVAKVAVASKEANFPEGTRVLTPTKMTELLDNLNAFVIHLAHMVPLPSSPKKIADIQSDFGLLPDQFISKYTVALH